MDYRSAGRVAAKSGNLPAAIDAFARLLKEQPDDVEALSYLAMVALRGGQYSEANRLLVRALHIEPTSLTLRENYGIALALAGKPEQAIPILDDVLTAEPGFFVARLFRGRVASKVEGNRRAMGFYTRALRDAQARGKWGSHETTPHWLRPFVRDAIQFTNASRRELLNAILERLRRQYGDEAVERVSAFVDELVGPPSKHPANSLQRPKQHFFYGIPEKPFFERELFPWMDAAESLTAQVREDLRISLQREENFSPFMDLRSPDDIHHFLRGESSQPPRWDAYFFYRHGVPYVEHLLACPAVERLLDILPLVCIEGFAPEVCFSILRPGTHILPHTGDANLRAVFHLPLVIPENCALQVAGKKHDWREGRGIVFDDTFEHEAWNYSDHDRIVLIADVWNPYLTMVERAALSELVPLWGQLVAEASA